jgi:hypothetical protein
LTPDFGHAARLIIVGEPGDASNAVAERAAQACERFTNHLARLLGSTGAQLLLRRSVVLATAQFPWLSVAQAPGDTVSALRTAMEQQDPESITEAFVAVLTALVGLLERLIGEGLVARQLNDVWPTVFPHLAKDTP